MVREWWERAGTAVANRREFVAVRIHEELLDTEFINCREAIWDAIPFCLALSRKGWLYCYGSGFGTVNVKSI